MISEGEKEMENKVLDYEIVEDIALLLESDVIIYGTSGRAEHFYPLLNRADLHIVACCDGASDKIGRRFHQWEIESLSDVMNRVDVSKAIIIICSTFVEEIIEDCNKTCNSGLKFVTSFGLKTAFWFNRKHTKLSMEFRNWYNETYNMWIKLQGKARNAKIQLDYNNKLIQFMSSEPVLVYQMGKVGSAGIYHSLQSANIECSHLHYFQPWNNHIPVEEHKEYVELLQQIIHRKEKIKIITLFRDPLARDISAFFQTIGNPVDDIYRNCTGSLTDSIIKLLYTWICPTDSFLATSGLYINPIKDINLVKEDKTSVFAWFDMELKEVFNVDIYNQPFDKERGYSIIRQDNIECLVLKLEKLDLCHDIIREFVNKKDLSILNDNIGADKEYGFLYNEIKKNISIPQELIDCYYNDTKIRHFYTEEEISLFKNKWKNNG